MIWIILAGIFGGWFLAVLVLSLWSYWTPKADAVHFVTTSDGWKLAIHELKPDPAATPAPRPVILCHGILMSRHCWLPPDGVPAVARILQKRGYHLYIVEMRGSGRSTRKWDYGFLDYADKDVPAFVEEVKRLSGASSVDWVGHSMGGLIGYSHLARHGAGSIHKMVTLGSPTIMGRAINRLFTPFFVGPFLRLMRSINLSRLCRATAPFLLWSRWPWVVQFINIRGMNRRFGMGVMTWAPQATATRMLLDFLGWHSKTGPLIPMVATNPVPYPEPPGGILALYGGYDFMAPERAVTPVPQWFPNATVELIDPPGGRPFGHLDLLAGPPEVERVADRIDRFLRAEVSAPVHA